MLHVRCSRSCSAVIRRFFVQKVERRFVIASPASGCGVNSVKQSSQIVDLPAGRQVASRQRRADVKRVYPEFIEGFLAMTD